MSRSNTKDINIGQGINIGQIIKVKMSSFNIIVPSDTNSELYPENTSSRFKVRLSEPIELDPRGNWEVALAD